MFKKLLTLVLTVALTLSCVGKVEASEVSEREPYTYKVTLYAGNKGTFTGKVQVTSNNEYSVTKSADEIVVSGLAKGDEVVLTQADVTVTDEKYYVQGIRLSGRDNDDTTTIINVKKDIDYVVAYGIKGNQVSYTVNYVDVDGNVLAEADTFYGNVGDKPVVAYKYIEGFVPEVIGFTKTLSEDASENVFTFVYDEAPTPTIIVDYVTGGGTSNVNGQGGAGQDDDAQAGEGQDDVQPGQDDDVQGGDQGNQGETGSDEPDDIVDLDDDETPGANIDVDGANMGMIGGIGIAVAAAIALIILILFMMKKRKEQQ